MAMEVLFSIMRGLLFQYKKKGAPGVDIETFDGVFSS